MATQFYNPLWYSMYPAVAGNPPAQFTPCVEQKASNLTFAEYDAGARSTATYDNRASIVYPLLGLCGEVGEVADKLLHVLFPNGKPEFGGLEYVLYSRLMRVIEASKDCEFLKKMIRDRSNDVLVTEEALDKLGKMADSMTGDEESAIGKELGDCQWYVSILAQDIGLTGEEVAANNLTKLRSRKERGRLQGSGDNR